MNGADKHKEFVKAGDGLLSQIGKVHEYPTEPLTEKKLCELHGVDSTGLKDRINHHIEKGGKE